jgi:methyl-accepting chemotaxis protein
MWLGCVFKENIYFCINKNVAMKQLEIIQNKIYEIRGQRVMLDIDLAEMYGVETKNLKRAVKRNIERFDGEDFMFEVTQEELSRCQIGTLNTGRGKMISQPKSNKLSEFQQEVRELKQYMEEVLTDQNDINEDTRTQLELINQTLAELQVQKRLSDKPRRPIGFIRPKE